LSDILADIATRDIIRDGAFKIFLKNPELFGNVVEDITGDQLPDECEVLINGEIQLTVNGKAIQPDTLTVVETGTYNIEVQTKSSGFPFHRHLFYWATIYANSLKSGEDYKDLKPVVSIVIFKDKGGVNLREDAYLSGTLTAKAKAKNHLQLIAINAAKWKEAKNERLKYFLALVHNGIYIGANR